MEQVSEQKKTNVLLQYGLMSALVYTAVFVVFYLMGAESLLSFGGYVTWLIPIAFAVLACLKAKKDNQGFLEFREALKIGFGVMVLTSLVNMIFSYVLFNFIDPAFAESVTQILLEKTEKMLGKFGAPESVIDKAVKDTMDRKMYSLPSLFQSFMFTSIFNFILALIIAAIVKKKKPEFESQ